VHDVEDRRRDFGCKGGGLFFLPARPRAFTIVRDDPRDASHIVSFSGEKGSREQDKYLGTASRPHAAQFQGPAKVDGLPVPLVNPRPDLPPACIIATRQISSISAMRPPKTAEIRTAIRVRRRAGDLRRIRQSSLEEERARAKKAEQLECRRKAAVARVLRATDAYVIDVWRRRPEAGAVARLPINPLLTMSTHPQTRYFERGPLMIADSNSKHRPAPGSTQEEPRGP